MASFTTEQELQIRSRGTSIEEANSQLELFRQGIPPVVLFKPATPGDGIEQFNDEQTGEYIRYFDNKLQEYTPARFIPASGAASRMFKTLFEAFDILKENNSGKETAIEGSSDLRSFFGNLKKYPFYDDLSETCRNTGKDIDQLSAEKRYSEILELLLFSPGLNYGGLPKGMLKFHSYHEGNRTAVHEHMVETSGYLAVDDVVNLHFTVSPEHKHGFENLVSKLNPLTVDGQHFRFDVTFSEQKLSTDTLAVTMENKPFTTGKGELLFRPGGHGALLDNLMEMRQSVVFIGNIDNVAPDRVKALRIRYKKLLGGILMLRRDEIFSILKEIDTKFTSETKEKIIRLVQNYISKDDAMSLGKMTGEKFVSAAKDLLYKPIRVCGMVKNTGEPGGGPFWIRYKNSISKQIVESSQIDLGDPGQKKIFTASTHFNPVDLACSLNDYQGKRFDLHKFRNPEMAFIATKSYGPEKLKALELPGLWNGAMSDWITFFVEVPAETFSPVKTVFDMVRPEHLS